MKRIIHGLICATAFIIHSNAYASSNEPALTIVTPTTKQTFDVTQLLKMNVVNIPMTDSRAYPGMKINYTAIKLCDLLKPFHVKESDTIEFITTDHFSSLIPASFILHCTNKTSIGYLAIEPIDKPWPKLKYNNTDATQPDAGTAGPFAVIWVNPAKSYISNEYWAWKVTSITVHDKLDAKSYISAPDTHNKQILNGYNAYISRCATCHTINNIGKATIGPDLNIPKNPTEYYSDETLKKFIRDPQSVRKKKNDRMSGTNEESLSNHDLNALVEYLHYMAKHKS
jgi:cytochrome c2